MEVQNVPGLLHNKGQTELLGSSCALCVLTLPPCHTAPNMQRHPRKTSKWKEVIYVKSLWPTQSVYNTKELILMGKFSKETNTGFLGWVINLAFLLSLTQLPRSHWAFPSQTQEGDPFHGFLLWLGVLTPKREGNRGCPVGLSDVRVLADTPIFFATIFSN